MFSIYGMYKVCFHIRYIYVYKKRNNVTWIINALSDDIMFLSFLITAYKFGFKLQITFRLSGFILKRCFDMLTKHPLLVLHSWLVTHFFMYHHDIVHFILLLKSPTVYNCFINHDTVLHYTHNYNLVTQVTARSFTLLMRYSWLGL